MPPVPSSFSMSSSSLSPRFCFNRECSAFELDHYRPGWRLRTGDFVDLCDSCASAYEQGKFCDVFHRRASGWRCCESCGKRIHCGCVVSASAFVLLDAGGIECFACARKRVPLGPKFSPLPSSFLYQSPISEKFKDLSINWGTPPGSNQISCQPPSLLGPSVLQFGSTFEFGSSFEFSQPTPKDRTTACSTERKRGMSDYFMGQLMSAKSKNCNLPPYPSVGVYNPLISLKESPCGSQFAFPVSTTTPIETVGHSRLDGSKLWHTPNSSPLSHLHNDVYGGGDSPLESKSANLRTRVDKRGKYQVVPRYRPKVSNKNKVLQKNISKEPEFAVVPLFEKRLSASDTGRAGRLVLPKKCAESYLPRISEPEGEPLDVLDALGKEWNFQFRFCLNHHKSRMYFLEGVFPCIRSMQLQAGDTVIFSRLDPERKLIMGFRKASGSPSSDQETGSTNNNNTNGDEELVVLDSPPKVRKSADIAKENLGVEFSSGKNMMITRSKRRKVENADDLTEMKLTREEAQRFILPPPDVTPSIVEIEDFEFEEYEEAPIIGKPTLNDTGVGSEDEEIVAEDEEAMEEEEVEETISMPPQTTTTKHPRHRIGCTCIVCVQSPSGKGPKHDPSCSCTVCEMQKRRKRSLLLNRENREKKHLELVMDLFNYDHQSPNNSTNQIDLNFQPDKDDESLLSLITSTKNKSCCLKPPPSSSNQDEGKL